MTQEQHQQALNAIGQLETNIQRSDKNIGHQLISQQKKLLSLERQMRTLGSSIANLNKNKKNDGGKSEGNNANMALTNEPQIVYVEKEVPILQEPGKIILGEVEWLWFDETKTHFKARIDTGATTSSLNASDIQEFERDGKTWVRFKLANMPDNPKTTAHENTIEAPVKRWVKIRQSTSQTLERRPVIELRVRIGSLHEKAQFTLADRSHMEFPILLGREFFKDIAMVDVSQSYIHPRFNSKEM